MKPYPVLLRLFQVLCVLALAGFAADSMPYDSIGNPLNLLPPNDGTVQWKGDSLNLVPNRFRVNQAGYRQRDVAAGYAKFYCVGCPSNTFNVVDGAGTLVGSGTLTSKGATVSGQITAYASNSAEHATGGFEDWKKGYPQTGKVVSGALTQGVLPATLPPGRYTIRSGADSSVPFVVSDNVYGMARDAALKFFGLARSGDFESWFHGPSHTWDGWLYDSAARNPDGTYKYKGALQGGWYDCGNHLKEARTISYPLATLGMLAATMREKDADRYALNQNVTLRTDGIPDVLREAWVGARFVFNSWRLANGKASDMILSVGNLTNDFAWWGRPENQDAVLSKGRGGRKERHLLKNWGSGSMSDFAAGLAFLSKMYRPYDAAFADSALVIARAMYQTAKDANRQETAPDYTGDISLFDDLALGAVALFWATGERTYLKEAAYTPGMPDGFGGICKSADYGPGFETTRFEGGFFGCGTNGMKKNGGPTDYGTANSLALYSFVKLILADPDTALAYGIDPAQRDTLLLRSINQMAGPLWGSGAGASFTLPIGGPYDQFRLSYDSLWYSMSIGYGKSGWWNKYQFGNLADLYMFYDMTSIVEGRTILDKPGSTDWKRKEVLQVLLGGLNYMFGTNALDLSYLYGIGRKNPMHPHHRSSNPEGRNVPGAYYNYRIPVGGLYGGLATGPAANEALEEYFDQPVAQTEANCPDAQAAVMIPLMGLAGEAYAGPPRPVVKVLYTTDTSATLQVDLDKWGTLVVGYGLDSVLALQTTKIPGNDTGNTFTIHLGKLTPATRYYFHVAATDLLGATSTTSRWPGSGTDSIAFSFTTKAQALPPPTFGNIKVCNVTSDSAEVMWYTPAGEYLSAVRFADSVSWKSATYSVVDTDVVGNVPVQFHRVKLKGLKAKTTYNFQVGVPGSFDPTVGCFRTPGEDVKFEIRTTHYMWDGHPAMGLAVVNQDVKSYDSLQIRLYVNGTKADLLDLAARVDIAFAYRTDGFADSGLFVHTKNVQRSRPQLLDPSCPETSNCAWYFDLPLHGAVMESQARWRLDVLFDRHNLIRDSTEILNMAPTHDPFAGTDWSFRPHVAGADGGLSPVDYPGVPDLDKNAIDVQTQDIPVNPYIAVYRRNEFIYGFSPSAVEQSTKRTVFAMDAVFDKPFEVTNGNTIQMGAASATRLAGTLDVYDVMLPEAKGYINSIWVNGTAISETERKAALSRQHDGTWKIDLPLRFAAGTNKLDVVFFAGSDSMETVATDACSEGKGCAFLDAHWYVNFASNRTASLLSVVDAAEAPVRTLVPDSSTIRLRVADWDANLSKTAPDAVTVTVTSSKDGSAVKVSLAETGPSTGVFQTDLLAAVSAAAAAGQIRAVVGDTLTVKYVDATDPDDDNEVRLVVPSTTGPSSLVVVDGAGIPLGLIVPDLSVLRVVVSDLTGKRTVVDTVSVVVLDLRTRDSVVLRLPETGAATGVFQTDLLKSVSGSASAGQLRAIPGDSLSFRYVDPADPTDVSSDTIWSEARWPLVSKAWISTLCGATPSLEIVFDRSLLAPGQTVPVAPRSVSVRLRSPDGDSLVPVLAAGSWVVSGPALDRVTVSLPASASGRSDWTGSVTLEVPDGQGGWTPVVGAVTDSIGPWIDSARIVENDGSHPLDSVTVWVSEGLAWSGPVAPVVVYRAGQPVPMASVAGFRPVDALSGTWLLTLAAGTAKAGDSISLAASVKDPAGNVALVCPEHRVRIAQQWRPTSVAASWVLDSDGDARADQIVLVYKRPLRPEEVPTAIAATFGPQDSLRQSVVTVAAGDSVVVVNLPPWAFGDTRGSGPSGEGTVSLYQGVAPLGSAPLADSVGPVLRTASLRYGAAADSLVLGFSEPVSATGLGDWMQLLAPAGWTDLVPVGVPVFVDGTVWSFPVDTFQVQPGDSVKPEAAGSFRDAGNQGAASAHPGVVVTGTERPPVGARMLDVDGDGAAETVELVWARAPRTQPGFVIRWPSLSGGLDSVVVGAGTWSPGPDPLKTLLPVGPFERGVTSSRRTDLGSMLAGSESVGFPIADAVAPVLQSAEVRYAGQGSDRDTLVVRWSEPVSWLGTEPLLLTRDEARDTSVHAFSTTLSFDSLGAVLLLDPSGKLTSAFQRGDSLRLAPASAGTVFDRWGNASEPGWWVPVQFGRRPSRFEVVFQPRKRIYGGWPLAGKSPFDLQVRARGSETWQDLSTGTPIPAGTEEHQIGPVVVANQQMRGVALIYDNQGTFVASADLDALAEAFGNALLPTDPSDQYEVRIAWNGLTQSGDPAASGVYLMRLVMRKNLAGDGELPEWDFYNQLFQFGWEVPGE